MTRQIFFAGLFTALLFITGCSGSLEDTYKEFSGDGPIHYVGKCDSVQLVPNWEQLKVKWTPSTDAAVEKIKIVCSSDKISRDTIVSKNKVECIFDKLPAGSYQVDVYGVDQHGTLSLPSSAFGRPYSEEHELYVGFPLIISRYYFIKGWLVLFLDKWQPDAFVEIYLKYTNHAGVEKTRDLDESTLNTQFCTINDVDPSKPVTLIRWGKLPESEKSIKFKEITLSTKKSFSGDMKALLTERHQATNPADETFINGLTTLELDYNMVTIEDILNFPNLTKIEIGKNRYFRANYLLSGPNGENPIPDNDFAKISNEFRAQKVLKFAQDRFGLQIYTHYEKIYSQSGEVFKNITVTKSPVLRVLPAENFLNTTNWTIHCEAYEDQAKLRNLLDNNPETTWSGSEGPSMTTYQILIDMQEERTVNGFKIVQASISPASSPEPAAYFNSSIMIETSKYANGPWKNASVVKNNSIGKTNGEGSIIKMVTPEAVRFIRVTLNDGSKTVTKNNVNTLNFMTFLADIAIY